MFRILWPTIRPEAMKKTYAFWCSNASNRADVTVKIAVNTSEERTRLSEFKDVIVIGSERRGACFAVHQLTRALLGEPDDVVILASDDFFPPKDWDLRLKKEFADFDGALLVNDGIRKAPIMTIPILTFACLLKLNRILNHPDYRCQWADRELYDNLSEMGALKDARVDQVFVFEHRHWTQKKRSWDDHDRFSHSLEKQDKRVYERRKKLPLEQRLTTTPVWPVMK